MKHQFRQAFNALKKIGAPVYERSDIEQFQISAEHNFDDQYGGELWADFYDAQNLDGWNFGVNPKIDNILRRYNLHCEWINAGELGVYED